MQRQPDDVSAIRESLDAIHELLHEEEATTILALDAAARRVDRTSGEVEASPLVGDLDDEHRIVDACADVNVLVGGALVAAKNRVRQRLRQRHWNVQMAVPWAERVLHAFAAHPLDDVLNEADVARDAELDLDAWHRRLALTPSTW